MLFSDPNGSLQRRQPGANSCLTSAAISLAAFSPTSPALSKPAAVTAKEIAAEVKQEYCGNLLRCHCSWLGWCRRGSELVLDIQTDFLTDAPMLVSSGAILDCMDNPRHKAVLYYTCAQLFTSRPPSLAPTKSVPYIHAHAKSTQGRQSR